MKHSSLSRLVCLFLVLSLLFSLFTLPTSAADSLKEVADNYDGSQLWLNYRLVSDSAMLNEYRTAVTSIVVENYAANPTFRHSRNGSVWVPQQPSNAKETIPVSSLEAARLELSRATSSLLGKDIPLADSISADGAVVVGTPKTSPLVASAKLDDDLSKVGNEGYVIRSVKLNGKNATVIAGNTEIGALYGTYTFIRQMQTLKSVNNLNIVDQPKVNHRRLNNWDAERLYAGTNATGEGSSTGGDGSMFCFSSNSGSDRLPLILDRYIVFARMCASVGINEITINNVNADYAYLSESYIQYEAALADALRPYGVHIGLSVRYVSPTQDGCNTSADTSAGGPSKISGNDANNPYAEKFQNWWTKKTEQIRSRIPDFVGYTVKANSEGQPGPQDYGYDHGDGAYGLGQALAKVSDGKENKMTLFWRTFVYNASVDTDRLKRAYMEFKPINDDPDRGFGDNVFVQTKNGPLDFQGREPVHPMFGAMDATNQAIEVQITQEYTGHHISLCYLGTEWEEIFKTDTYAEGEGTPVGAILDGSAQGQKDTAIVGVNNIGNAPSMTGNHFGQANFFSFGRQAWDWTLDAEDIAEDWVRMTWSNDKEVVETIVAMMMGSYEALVCYQTPYGVGHQMTGTGTHYYPNPAQIIFNGGTVRDDWSPTYYSRVDGVGVGYNRTNHKELSSAALQMGSGLADQYAEGLAKQYNNIETTPENLLLWFHHVPWDYEMSDGRTFWEDAVYLMQMGVQYVSWMREAWASLENKIDQKRFNEVTEKLWRQEIDASEWRDYYSSYWQANNNMDKPVDDGLLSIAITLGEGANSKTYQGFDLSVDSFNKSQTGNLPSSDSRYSRYIAAGGSIADASGSPFNSMFTAVPRAYTISVPAGISHNVSAVKFLNKDAAEGSYEIVSNTDAQAVIKVKREGPFGPLVKTYTFNFVADATLADIQVNGISIDGFDPDTLSYAIQTGSAVVNAPYVTVTPNDPAASVKIKQADSIPGKATVTVKSSDDSKTYSISFAPAAEFSEDFNGSKPADDWNWVRENASNWKMADSALTITTASGDIKGSGNNAQNILLHNAGEGDWEAVAKLQFSAVPSQTSQQGGIVVYQDDNNFIRVNVEFVNSSGVNHCRAAAGVERGGSFSDMFYDALETEENIAASGKIVWLKLVKKGNDYRAYWATDGNAEFKSLGKCNVNLKNPQIGTLAAGNSLKVSYDSISLTDNYDMIVTEDGGEHPDEPVQPSTGNLSTIDFTDPASSSKITIENQASSEIRSGEGLYLVSTTDAFEPCNGQVSTFEPKDVVKIPVNGDWTATMKVKFDQGGSQGYYEFFGIYAMEDYDNCVGIRAGDGSIQDFLRTKGDITAETDGVKTDSGLKSAGTHWFRIAKEGTTYVCSWSTDGEEFSDIFTYEDTGIDATDLCLDAYSGMSTGYNYLVEYVEFETAGLQSIDFKDSNSASQFEIVNQNVSEIREGEGLYMITTKDAFEPANDQLSGDAATTPKDLVLVPVGGDWTATLKFNFNQNGASNGYYQFFGFYAMEDYNNCVGIRGGNNDLQDFIRVDGAVTAETMNSNPGLGSNGTYWFRIEKSGTTYICYRSSDGEEFAEMFRYEDTGIEAENIAIDAYTGMTTGYAFMLDTLEFEGGSSAGCDHDFKAVVTKPTCTETGYTTFTCAKCGKQYTDNETKALGHDFQPEITAPTCLEMGYTIYSCSRCGKSYKTDRTAPYGHKYVDGECVRCGEKDPEYTPVVVEPCKGDDTCPSKNFSDVAGPSDWSHEGIDYCVKNNLMNGVGATTFNPKGTVTRAQLVTILYRVAQQPEVEFKSTFTDVPAGQWYSDPIEWAAANGIVNGTAPGKFNPMGAITREQIAAILYRFIGSPAVEGDLTAFPDNSKVHSYAEAAMVWAVNEGFINGIASNGVTNLAPQNNATRAQIASIIMRFMGSTYMKPEQPVEPDEPVPYEPNWVSTWATSEEKCDINADRMPQMALKGSTVRQIMRVTTSGDLMKLKLSNQYGQSDVVVQSMHIAKQVQADKSTIDPATDTIVTVNGSEEFVIKAGQTIETDPVDFSVNALDNVAVSIYFGNAPTSNITGHRGARATTYQVAGDNTSAETFTGNVKTTTSWFFLCDIALDMPEDARAIVCFGDSITDGYGTDADYLGRKPDSYTRWGDYFAKRLQADEKTKNVSVLNEGIGANAILNSYPTDAGKDRYARDLLDHDGVKYVIILMGVNDLQKLSNTSKYSQLVAEYQKMIQLAHDNDIKVYAAPILPFGNYSDYYSAASEEVRTMINDWFRSDASGVDAIIDFESAVADPNNPKIVLQKYTSDGLHPEKAYDVMADAIDLSLFY